jgi:glycosyltransferase involved in cell wall biosynthesis
MKVCFWGNIAHTLNDDTDGGGELQIALLAKALARGGDEVVILDYNTAEDFVTDDGIKVFKIDGWNDGIPAVRYLTHRLPRLYRSLKNQHADIYYCRIREFRHIVAYWAARKVGAKFILGMASDLDAMSLRMRIKNYYIPQFSSENFLWWFSSGIIDELVFPWLLRKSDVVFAQHEGQKQRLLQKGIKSILFSNLIDLSQIPVSVNQNPTDFIYVGSLDKRKGFAEFFEIIEKAPSYTFKIVGQPRDSSAAKYYEKLKSFHNVSLLGKLCHTDTLYQIASSKALISTSPMEGFPNIFIEAWACGIPVFSLYVDPGGVIKKEELGDVATGNLNLLLELIEKNDSKNDFSRRSKAYVEQNHSLSSKRIKEISKLFNEIIKM